MLKFSLSVLCLLLGSVNVSAHWVGSAQFGGYQGRQTLGVSYYFEESAWMTDLSFGVTHFAQDPIYQINLKGLYEFQSLYISIKEGWSWKPLAVGSLLAYALGDEYFVLSPEQYPTSNYYMPNGLSLGLLLRTKADWNSFVAGPLESLSIYLDLVTMDKLLIPYYNNPGYLELEDVFALALGFEFHF